MSTGTWFVAMRLPESEVATSSLPEGRDCLVNVDSFGRPVPSARFMGGREIESVIALDTRQVDIKPDQPALVATVPELLRSGAMFLPTPRPGLRSFPRRTRRVAERAGKLVYPPCRRLPLCRARRRYLARSDRQPAATPGRGPLPRPSCLSARSPRCARRPRCTLPTPTTTSRSALRLIDPTLTPDAELTRVEPLDGDLAAYRQGWRAAIEVPA